MASFLRHPEEFQICSCCLQNPDKWQSARARPPLSLIVAISHAKSDATEME